MRLGLVEEPETRAPPQVALRASTVPNGFATWPSFEDTPAMTVGNTHTLLFLLAMMCVTGCNAQRAVVRTAARARDPWTCHEDRTQMTKVGYGRYRLEGCGQSAVYTCNFALTPASCWR